MIHSPRNVWDLDAIVEIPECIGPAVRILIAVRINEFAILLEESSAVANVFHTKTGSDVWRYGRIRRIESAEMKKVDKGRR